METARVLIVEDNHLLSTLAEKILKSFGIQTQVVRNGQQAVDAVTHNTYGLILMDISMPIMDGFEATKRIRALELRRGRHTPIVAITALDNQSECLQAGMDEHHVKPANYRMIASRWFPFDRAVEAY